MSERTPLYRVQLSRHRSRGLGWTKHYTVIVIMRDGREVGRAYSDHYDSWSESVSRARCYARNEAKFLRSLGKIVESAHV